MNRAFCKMRGGAQIFFKRSIRSISGKWLVTLGLLSLCIAFTVARADEPYAPTREYDLQNARIELHFDLAQKKVIGQVTHTLATLQDSLRQLDFDSAELQILGIKVNGSDAHFSTDSTGLHVSLSRAAKIGEKFEVAIRYQGTPQRGLYFILPDANYPQQPAEIWTQGEAEDTRFYIPIYDYPNNRETTEMIVTVPKDWTTVSNGKLESVVDAGNGEKTWTWHQSEPIATYLISLVAGQFDSSTQSWRNVPVDYHVPHGLAADIAPTFAHTRDMLTFFSDRLGVPYPWVKYDQTMVDQFVEGGMENASATTLTVHGLQDPLLARESLEGSDNLISHEMSHQWFGDLVTCKDWSNLWLNEGFATFMAQLWEEHQYGLDNASYSRWRAQAAWFRQRRLFDVPIVTHDFTDSMANAGNIYGKAGLVLQMLRDRLGDAAFFGGLHKYLEAHRLGNVVTADLVKAMEDSSHVNLDRFFGEWIDGAGAPKFTVSSSYDSSAKALHLDVKQTQEIRGRVGIFEVPVQIGVTTAFGTHSYSITVSKAEETFSFPADSAPLMVLFDQGDKILKTVDFHKSPTEWIYQLQMAGDVADRSGAAEALGELKGNADAIAALGHAALNDPFWGVRNEAISALGRIGGPEAEKNVVAALANTQPWVRQEAVTQLSRFHDNDVLVPRLEAIVHDDPAYRVREAALTALAQTHAPAVRDTLETAANTDSPDDVIRRAAVRAMGFLGDDKSVPTLLSYAAPGKSASLREAAIGSLGRLDKKNGAIESQVISYLKDSNFDVRTVALFTLVERGDPAAIAPLEAQLHSGPTLGDMSMVEQQIARLKRGGAQRGSGREGATGAAAADPPSAGNEQPAAQSSANAQIVQRLDRLEQQLSEVNDRLKKIEQSLPTRTAASKSGP